MVARSPGRAASKAWLDSTAEAEFIAASKTSAAVVTIRQLLEDLEVEQLDPTPLYCDNIAVIRNVMNPVQGDRAEAHQREVPEEDPRADRSHRNTGAGLHEEGDDSSCARFMSFVDYFTMAAIWCDRLCSFRTVAAIASRCSTSTRTGG